MQTALIRVVFAHLYKLIVVKATALLEQPVPYATWIIDQLQTDY